MFLALRVRWKSFTTHGVGLFLNLVFLLLDSSISSPKFEMLNVIVWF